jgi:hypothetical protein
MVDWILALSALDNLGARLVPTSKNTLPPVACAHLGQGRDGAGTGVGNAAVTRPVAWFDITSAFALVTRRATSFGTGYGKKANALRARAPQ